MSRDLLNTVANFLGSASSSVLAIVFTVVYFRILGTESYGLVSFCTTILIIGDVIVNRGIGGAVTREIVGDDLPARGELRPHFFPDERGARRAMDQDDRRAFAVDVVADAALAGGEETASVGHRSTMNYVRVMIPGWAEIAG